MPRHLRGVGHRRQVVDGNRRTFDRAQHRLRFPAFGIVERHAERARELADSNRRLAISVAHAARTPGDPDPDQDLPFPERREERTGDELRELRGAHPFRSEHVHLRPEQQKDDEPVCGGVGVRDAAANGAAVSHRAVGDSARGRGQPSMAGVRHCDVLDLGVGDGRAEENRFPVVAVSPQIGAGTDVDEEVGLHEPQVQHRPERLSTRDDLRVPVRRGQQLDRVGRVPGAGVAEGGGLHDTAPEPGLMAVADTRLAAVPSDPASTPEIARTSMETSSRARSTPVLLRKLPPHRPTR